MRSPNDVLQVATLRSVDQSIQDRWVGSGHAARGAVDLIDELTISGISITPAQNLELGTGAWRTIRGSGRSSRIPDTRGVCIRRAMSRSAQLCYKWRTMDVVRVCCLHSEARSLAFVTWSQHVRRHKWPADDEEPLFLHALAEKIALPGGSRDFTGQLWHRAGQARQKCRAFTLNCLLRQPAPTSISSCTSLCAKEDGTRCLTY